MKVMMDSKNKQTPQRMNHPQNYVCCTTQRSYDHILALHNLLVFTTSCSVLNQMIIFCDCLPFFSKRKETKITHWISWIQTYEQVICLDHSDLLNVYHKNHRKTNFFSTIYTSGTDIKNFAIYIKFLLR